MLVIETGIPKYEGLLIAQPRPPVYYYILLEVIFYVHFRLQVISCHFYWPINIFVFDISGSGRFRTKNPLDNQLEC